MKSNKSPGYPENIMKSTQRAPIQMPQDNLQKYKMQLLNGIENVIFAGTDDKEGIFNSEH